MKGIKKQIKNKLNNKKVPSLKENKEEIKA